MKKKVTSRKPGRPKGSTAATRRETHIQIRLFESEKAKYREAAKSAGISLTDWVKQACDEKLDDQP